jgi:hypothetical protein
MLLAVAASAQQAAPHRQLIEIVDRQAAYFSSISKTIWDGTRLPGRKKFNAPAARTPGSGLSCEIRCCPAGRPRLS